MEQIRAEYVIYMTKFAFGTLIDSLRGEGETRK